MTIRDRILNLILRTLEATPTLEEIDREVAGPVGAPNREAVTAQVDAVIAEAVAAIDKLKEE